jgi:short subunit dehydrogenase-like uncharacterized protein
MNHYPFVYITVAGGYASPFIMASINRAIVHRTNALLNYQYGAAFAYDEFALTRGGASTSAWVKTWLTAHVTPLAIGLLSFAPMRWLAKKCVPQPGEGPSVKTRCNGRIDMLVVGRACDAVKAAAAAANAKIGDDVGNDTVVVRAAVTTVKGLDPGCNGTAVMLVETALAMLARHDAGGDGDIGSALVATGGLITPVVACGHSLTKRLRTAGIDISVGGADGVLSPA